MASFGWFGEQEHKVFNYKPIYYDQEADERRRRHARAAANSDQGKDGESTYVPGSQIQGAFRSGNYAKRRTGATKAQSLIGLIGLVLVALVLIYITKFYALL